MFKHEIELEGSSSTMFGARIPDQRQLRIFSCQLLPVLSVRESVEDLTSDLRDPAPRRSARSLVGPLTTPKGYPVP